MKARFHPSLKEFHKYMVCTEEELSVILKMYMCVLLLIRSIALPIFTLDSTQPAELPWWLSW